MKRMTEGKSLTLAEWIESVQNEGRAPLCPGCSADGEWDRWEEESGEVILDVSFACGSQAQVISASGDDSVLPFTDPPQSPFYLGVYESLKKSCPVFGKWKPRRRLWRYAR